MEHSGRKQGDFLSPQPKRKNMVDEIDVRSQSSANLNGDKSNLYLHKMILKLKQQQKLDVESPLKMPGLDSNSVAIINYQS